MVAEDRGAQATLRGQAGGHGWAAEGWKPGSEACVAPEPGVVSSWWAVGCGPRCITVPTLTATFPPAPEQPARHRDLDAAGRQESGIPAGARPRGPLLPAGCQLLWQELWEAADDLPQSGFFFLKS